MIADWWHTKRQDRQKQAKAVSTAVAEAERIADEGREELRRRVELLKRTIERAKSDDGNDR